MRPIDIIKFYVNVSGTWTEYTDGILNINIDRGLREYTGPTDLPDAGILTLTSRSYTLDPYVNSNIRIGKTVKVEANGTPIFTGTIIDVNVQYSAKGKPPTVTFNAVDYIGTMQQHVLRDTFKTRLGGSTMGRDDFEQELEICGNSPGALYEEIPNWNVTSYRSFPGTCAAGPPSGTTAWDFYTQILKSQFTFIYADVNNYLWAWDDFSWDNDSFDTVWTNGYGEPTTEQHPRTYPIEATFDSSAGAFHYFDVKLDDGFDNLCNRLTAVEDSTGAVVGTTVNSQSQSEWGTAKKTFSLIGITSDTTGRINRILQESIVPIRDIEQFTWNAKYDPNTAKNIEIMDNIQVIHEVDTFTINKKYGIIGISHNIDAENWYITYYLRNWYLYEEVIGDVSINVNPASGTTSTNFQFSINNLNMAKAASVQWDWNNNGIYDQTGFVVNHTFASTGNIPVTAKITDIYGLTKVLTTTVNVSAVIPTSSWTWQVSPSDSGLIEFTYTGSDATQWVWNWGDSTTYGNYPVMGHRYTTSGNKTVRLTAINDYGQTQTQQVISVTPGTVTNQTGTRPIRYLMIDLPNERANATTNFFPLMSKLKALTSTTATNRASTGTITYYSPTAPEEGIYWQNNTNTTVVPTDSPATLLTTSSTTTYGLQPNSTLSGLVYRKFTLIIDLGAPYYDIDAIKLTLSEIAADADYNNINFYARFSSLPMTSWDGTLSGWTQIGTLNPTTLGNDRPMTETVSLPMNF